MTDKADEIAALLSPTVESLGLELLGIEYLPAPGGATVRLYIDVPQSEGGNADAGQRSVGIEDCETVSREVSAQLDVADPISGNYTLEVSSPGLDRPLRRMADYVRFEGAEIDVTLRQVFQGRKKYRGILRLAGKDPDASLELIFRDGKDKDEQVLGFTLDEVREARLVPVVDFKGRGRTDKDAGAAAGEAAEQEPGGHEE